MGDGPIDVLVNDFDGDNLPDYVSAAFRSDEFWICLSTKSTPTRLAKGDMPVQVETGFYNSDEYLDLALGSRGYGSQSGAVQIMFGSATGEFTVGPILRSAGKLAALATADLQQSTSGGGGQRDELITLGEDGRLRVFAVDSSSLTELESIELGSATSKVHVGDIDGDSHPDVVVVRPQPGEVNLLLGNGTGRLIRGKMARSASSVVDVAFGDLDGSGRDSLVIASLLGASGSGGGSTNLLRLGVDKQDVSLVSGVTKRVDFSPTTLEARMDVNANGSITMIDALQVINRLNAESAELAMGFEPSPEPLGNAAVLLDLGARTDVNGDGHTTPLDALIVINHVNARESRLAVSGEPWSSESPLSNSSEFFLSPDKERFNDQTVDEIMAETGGLF